MAEFADHAVLQGAGGPRRTRLRLGPPGEVQAARRPGRRQRRPRRQRDPRGGPVHVHAARLPPPPGPQGGQRPAGRGLEPQRRRRRRTRSSRSRTAPSSSASDGQVLADLMGTGTQFVAAAGGRGGLGNAALASQRRKAPGLRAQGRAGGGARAHARAQDGRRHRPDRLPQRGQVLADRRHVRGPAEDRRLPVHHPHPEPRRRRGGRRPVRRRRRARPDPGRERGQGPRP